MNSRPTDEEYRQIKWWRRVLTMLSLAEYHHAQLSAEEELHQDVESMTEEEAQDLTVQRFGALAKYFKRVNLNPVIWAWGAGSKGSDDPEQNPGIEVVTELIMMVGALVACKPKEWAVVNGSCPWGIMSVFDAAWKKAAGTIFHIPLKFFRRNADEPHEPDCDAATEGCTAPKRVAMGARTDTFGNSGFPEGVLLGPGGSGSMFEFAWFLESIKFRNTLLTAFSGWVEDLLPPLVMLDYWMDPHGKDPLRARYFFEGERQNLITRILGGVLRQESLRRVVIVRIGEGEDEVEPGRVGPAVRYFATVEDAAAFIVKAFELKLVDFEM